ncbi:MAG: DnaJ domain-containing protein [Myxococcota bacterium]
MAPTPIAQGELSQTPLAHVIMSVHGRQMTGTLAVWPEEGRGQDRVLFKEGMIHGARLREAGNNLERGLLPLFQRTSAPYAFYEDDLVGAEGLRGHIDPYALVAASLRGGMRSEVVDAVLAAHGPKPLRVVQGVDLSRFSFIEKERVFLETLRAAPQNVADALRAAAHRKSALRVLYMLSIAQALEPFEGEPLRRPSTDPGQTTAPRSGSFALGSHPPSSPLPAARPSSRPSGRARRISSGSMRSPAGTSLPPSLSEPPGSGPEKPDGLSEAHSLRWNEVVGYANRIDRLNYFEMLEVSMSANADDVRSAYFTKVKKWHPDRLPAELGALRETADVIFGYLTEAEQTLSDETLRADYLKTVKSGGGTPKANRKLNAVLLAALEFQKVEVLLRRKNYDDAEKLVVSLIESVPDEADFHAALGAIVFRRDGLEAADQALKHLRKALKLNRDHERALMTKGRVYVRQGRQKEAYPLFEKVLQRNPKNVEAQRQLRLANMRSSDAPKAKSGGFLSGFFGSKKKK